MGYRWISVVGMLALALSLSTCGGSESDEDRIVGVVTQFATGIGSGDGTEACETLTGPYQREVLSEEYSGNCEDRIAELADNLGEEERDAFRSLEVTDIEMRGADEALARWKTAKPDEEFRNTGAYNMKKFGEEWKIDSQDESEGLR